MSKCEHDAFALRVLGDSMEPEFKEGHIIIIEPNAPIKDGSYVFAVYEDEYIFRQLVIDNGKHFLKPLNDKYPTLKISGLDSIKGIIIQRAGTRRKEHKYY